MNGKALVLILATIAAAPAAAVVAGNLYADDHVHSETAHSGGTDRNGCHNDRKNGGYHCH